MHESIFFENCGGMAIFFYSRCTIEKLYVRSNERWDDYLIVELFQSIR